MANFPTSAPSFAGFTSSHTLSADNHAAQHNLEQAEVVAVAAKIGTGPSTPTNNKVLRGNGTGTSTWAQTDLTSDITGILPTANGGTGANSLNGLTIPSAVLANPSITGTVTGGATYSSPVLTTPTIADHTNATHNHSSTAQGGLLNGANSITDGTLTPAELIAGTGSSWTWQSWTPTITLNGGGSNGNAVITGGFIQTGKTMHFWAKYVVGSTTDFTGLTSIASSLPGTMSAAFGAATLGSYGLGMASVAGGLYQLSIFHVSTTSFHPVVLITSSTYASVQDVATSIPAAWANGDKWVVHGSYEVA